RYFRRTRVAQITCAHNSVLRRARSRRAHRRADAPRRDPRADGHARQPKLARTNPDRPDEGDLPPDADERNVRIRRGWRLFPPGRHAALTRPTKRWWRRWRLF